MKPKVVSLFAGIGGFDLGLERAGFEVVRQVEIDRYCLRILNRHWPDVPKGKDIRKEEPETYAERYGTIDLICGGFPCQDLSVAGKRAGLAGERSGLFYELLRVADSNPASWVLAENVPGLLSSAGGADFATVLGELSGFFPEVPTDGWRNSGVCWGPKGCVAWRVLDAQYFGVAQRRRRVFIVRSPSTARGSAFEVLFEPDCVSGDPPPSRKEGERLTDTPTEGFGSRGVDADQTANGNYAIGDEVSLCLKASGDFKQDPTHETYIATLGHTQSNGLGVYGQDVANTLEATGSSNQAVFCGDISGPLTGGSGQRGWRVSAENAADGQLVVAATLRSGGDGGVPSSRGENLIRTVCGFQNQDLAHALRSNPSKADKPDSSTYVIAPTLAAKNEPANSQVTREEWYTISARLMGAVRRLTPTETERLQGFPDGWTLLGDKTPDSPRYKACGNAVCVNVAEWIGRRLMSVISEEAKP